MGIVRPILRPVVRSVSNPVTSKYGGIPWSSYWKTLKALLFSGGSDYVDCGNGSSLDLTDEITVEGWIKPQRLATEYAIYKQNAFWTAFNGTLAQWYFKIITPTEYRDSPSGYKNVPIKIGFPIKTDDLNRWAYIALTVKNKNTISHDGWTTKSSVPIALSDQAGAVCGGKLYIFNGYKDSSTDVVKTTLVYDPSNDTWAQKADSQTAKWAPGAACVGTKIYVFGGLASGGTALNIVEIYDTIADSWSTPATPLPTDVITTWGLGITCVVYNGLIHIFYSTAHYRYDPVADTYTQMSNVPYGATAAVVGIVGAKMYVLGGFSTNKTQILDIVADTWTYGIDFSYSTSSPVWVKENPTIGTKIYMTHYQDFNTSDQYYQSVFVYDTIANTYTRMSSARFPRDGGAGGIINGKIYVAGGRWILQKGLTFLEELDPSALVADAYGGNVKSYVNGIEVSNLHIPFSLATSAYHLLLGSSFNGAIDEVHIYNKALTATEILAHYNNGRGIHISSGNGLVAGYHLEEGSGIITDDFSGNANTGNLKPTGSEPTWTDGVSVPSLLSAIVISLTEIDLSWDGWISASLERSDDGGVTYNEIKRTNNGVLSYSDTGLTIGVLYHYRVRGFQGNTYYSYSNIVHPIAIPATLLDVTKTVGYFDFTNESTITKTSNLVSKVTDLSGSANHLLNAGADATKPIWSAVGISHTVNRYLQSAAFTYNQPVFVYLLVKATSWTAANYLFDGNTADSCLVYQTGTTPGIKAYAGGMSDANNDLTLNVWHIIRVLFSGINSKLIVDSGTPVTGNFGAQNPGGITFGNRNGGLYGATAQYAVAIYRKSTDNETTILNYLNAVKATL